MQAVIAGVPYTQAQLLDQALDKIKKMGLFIQNVVSWNARPPNEKSWTNFTANFTQAYDVHLESGPMAGAAGYHGAAAALSNDHSIGSITNSIAQMNMANNTNIRTINNSMSTANSKLRQALVITHQQLQLG